MKTSYQSIIYLTAAELTARQAAGTLPPAGTTIHVVDNNGVFVEEKKSAGVSSQPVSGGGAGGLGSVPTNWVANTAIDAGKIVLATVAVGGFVVGEQIYSTTAITTGATFNAAEALRFLSVPEDTTVVKKTDVKNDLISIDTNLPLSALQGKNLQDTTVKLTGAQTVAGIKTFTGTMIADGTVKLGDGQNIPSQAADVAGATNIFPNVTSTNTTTIANTDTAIRISRAGTSGTKWNNALDINIGSHTAGLNGNTQVDFRLNNGALSTPDMTALTLKGNGEVLVSANPTSNLGVATKQYVDTEFGKRSLKEPCRVAATGNVVIATGLVNGTVINGVTLATGNRVFLPFQTTTADRGIYIVPASGAASRATDFDATPTGEVSSGTLIPVSEGNDHLDSIWMLTTNGSITIGTTGLEFSKLSFKIVKAVTTTDLAFPATQTQGIVNVSGAVETGELWNGFRVYRRTVRGRFPNASTDVNNVNGVAQSYLLQIGTAGELLSTSGWIDRPGSNQHHLFKDLPNNGGHISGVYLGNTNLTREIRMWNPMGADATYNNAQFEIFVEYHLGTA